MDNDSDSILQKQLDAAMPWVGLYIAAASAVCTLAMAADAVNGFRHKKLWFPCKHTSLNAASLTVLAVAMKLPMDLNTVMMKSETDVIAKFSSLAFMSIMVLNFMPSLGSMNDKELLANVMGLCILITTIFGNVVIQFIELRRFLKPCTVNLFFMIPSALMLVQLFLLISLALMAPTMKRNLELNYEEKHKAMLEEEVFDMVDERKRLMKYWVMAESGSPQFVVARSVVCTAAALICWLSYIILSLIHIIGGTRLDGPGESTYGVYTKWIDIIQSIWSIIGAIVAMFRWFVSVMLRFSTTESNIFKIEDHWVQTLKDGRNSFAGLQIRPNMCRKYLHDLKWCVLTLCIGIQIFILLLSKVVFFFSVFIISPFPLCFSHIMKVDFGGNDSDTDLNLSSYVLLLEGDAELPPSFLKSMSGQADRMIQTGRRMQPSNLLVLLHKSAISNESGQFNTADCWTLPVVTLTTIAIALPSTALHKRRQLLSAVGEGLSLTEIVEKTLAMSSQLKNTREAARVTWAEVLFYSKWLGLDLRRATITCKSSNEVVKKLLDEAEGIVMEFKRQVEDHAAENPLNWPVKVVAANSMYGICQTILVSSVGEDDEMFERISVMIADILSACLINLPHAITKMCHQNSIEKRGRSVREAFLLLGKTEKVTELVRQQERTTISGSS